MFELKFAEKESFPGRGPCIELYGDYVTERVWEAVHRVVTCNLMSSPFYQAKQGFSVFFQGGHNDPRGKWILLEFWVDDIEKTNEFVRLLSIEVDKVLMKRNTQICVNPYKMGYDDGNGSYTALSEIHKETGCRVDWGCSMSPITFHPENNLEHRAVTKLCEMFQLPVTRWKDTWEV